MTRDQKIQAAKAMTEANIEHHRIHLEDGYVEATANDLGARQKIYLCLEIGLAIASNSFQSYETEMAKTRIWAIDKNGVFTTEF
jgi:hypothetical protein